MEAPNPLARMSDLPPEIILGIGALLEPRELAALILCSCRLAHILTPRLYYLATTWSSPRDKMTALMRSAEKGHTSIVRQLLVRNVETTPFDRSGWKALHYAANAGHEEVVHMLLEAGDAANWDDPDRPRNSELETLEWYRGIRNSPLELAARGGHQAIVCMLLRAGAGGRDVRDALHAAAAGGYCAMVEKLLETGVAPDVRVEVDPSTVHDVLVEDGSTALHLAASGGHDGVVRTLLKAGAAVNRQSSGREQRTPLYWAACSGHGPTVKLLLDAGADPICDGHGTPVTHVAVSSGDRGTVRAVLDFGINVDTRGPGQRTALHNAVVKGQNDMTQCLLDAGADISAADEDGKWAVHLAARHRDPDIFKILLDAHIRQDPQFLQCQFGCRKLLQSILPSRSEAAILLLGDNGANLMCERNGTTLLHYAAQYGMPVLARRLLELGADPYKRDARGKTSLDLAFTHPDTFDVIWSYIDGCDDDM